VQAAKDIVAADIDKALNKVFLAVSLITFFPFLIFDHLFPSSSGHKKDKED